MRLTPDEAGRLHQWQGGGDGPRPTACVAPFITLSFQSSGLVFACARKPSVVVGDVRRQSLRDIWNGPRLAALRRLLEDDRFEKECLVCGWFAARANFAASDMSRYRHFGVARHDPPYPRRLEFNLSNACNLECVHCNGELSSLIRARRDRLPPLPHVYGARFFAELDEFLPHLEDAVFLGGEPFLQPECFRIWERLIERRLPARCLITTNGTLCDERIERVLRELPVQLSVSLDGATAATVEAIRVGASFDQLLRNLQRFRCLAGKPGDRLILTYALMRRNWREFGGFIALAESFGADIYLNVVTDPAAMSLFRLPPAELRPIVEAMTADLARGRAAAPRNAASWEAVVTLLSRHAESAGAQPFEETLAASRARSGATR